MRILDRHILKTVLETLTTCVLTFLLLYVIVDVFSHLEDILKQHTSLTVLRQYYLSYLPVIFVQIMPMASLLAILYTFGKFNRDNEITAMRASGLSILQISQSVILLGIIASVFIFWVNDALVPQSLYLNQGLKEQMEGDRKAHSRDRETISNLSMYGLKNRLFFINRFNTADSTMEGIVILEHDERQNITRKIVASRAAFREGVWRFYQSITYDFDESGQNKGEPMYAEEEIVSIPESPRDFLDQRQRPEYMDISQLNNYIWKLSRSGATTVIRNLKVELYQRFSSPFTTIIIIMLGIPFALMMKKRATGLSSVGISILVGFLYYVVNAISVALGKSGIIWPGVSALLTPLLAAAFVLQTFKRLP